VQVTNSVVKYGGSPSFIDCSDTPALVFDRSCSCRGVYKQGNFVYRQPSDIHIPRNLMHKY
jgi:hypothetical protein